MKKHLMLIGLLVSSEVLYGADDKPDKVKDTPDFLQTDPDGQLPGDGSEYCAPVSVSNSFMWLASQGFSDLKPKVEGASKVGGSADKRAQIALIQNLGELMNTNPKIGTNVPKIMTGIDLYFQKTKYQYAKLEYQGWRPSGKWPTTKDVPDLKSLQDTLAEPLGLAWINLGWYLSNKKTKEFERSGGHWVTLVGVKDKTLFIHDPSPRAGKAPSTDTIELELLDDGMLTGKDKNLPRKAKGYFQIKGKTFSPDVLKKNVIAILDGFILFLPKR